MQLVTGKRLEFFASYVTVAYNIRVNSLVYRKTAGREYHRIRKIAQIVTAKTPQLFSIEYLTAKPKGGAAEEAAQKLQARILRERDGLQPTPPSDAASIGVRWRTSLFRTTIPMTLQTAVPVSAAQGPSRVRKHRSALPTEAAGLLPCITNFHYSLPLRLLLRASAQQTLRYFTLDFVGGPGRHSSRDSHARAAEPPVAPRAWAG